MYLLLYAGSAIAQYNPVAHAVWGAVTTDEGGAVVDSSDISYVVYETESGVPVCATKALECNIDLIYSQCMVIHATAKQISTGLESKPSNEVNACGGVRPNFLLSSPVIEVTIGGIGG
jgi:hypothetical protein